MNGALTSAAMSLALLSLASSPAAAKKKKSTFVYSVKAGDSCYSVAKRFLGSGSKYKAVHKHNPQLGPMPHVLVAGQRLTLPGKQQNRDATVAWLREDVRARPARAADWRKARRNMDLWRLYRVATGSDSAARIAFEEDKSRVHLRQNALLLIHGASARLAARKKLKPKASLVLEKGTIRGGLDALDQRAGLQVKTPAAKVDVQSRDTQIQVDETKASSISVFDGKAKVSAKGKSVSVTEGQGTRVEKGKQPAKPRPLPARVRWKDKSDVIVLVPQGAKGTFEARWKSARGARKYRVELAHDKRFKRIIVDAVVGAGVKKFRATDLAPGTYFARIAAIDGWRLQGRASKKLNVTIGEVRASRTLLPTSTADTYEVAGMLRLAPPESLVAQIEMALGDGPFESAKPLRLIKPGTYKVRLRAKGGATETVMSIRVLKVGAAIAFKGLAEEAAKKFVDAGQTVTALLQIKDEKGRAAALPGLQLSTSLAQVSVAVAGTGKGSYKASIPIPKDAVDGAVVLRLAWPGGELARESFHIKALAPKKPPKPEKPPKRDGFHWPHGPEASFGSTRRTADPLRITLPSTRVGLRTGARVASKRWNHRYGLTLSGELSLLDGDLGVGLDVDVYDDVQYGADIAAESDFGDISLGLRGVAFSSELFTLMAGLVLTVPTRELDGVMDGGASAGLVGRITPLSWMDIDITQTLGVWSDFGSNTHLAYGGTYGLTFKPIEDLGIGLRFDMRASVVTPEGDDSWLTLAIGGNVTWRVDRFRLGVFVLGGLNDDARERSGIVSGGLSLDIGFEEPDL